jgi:hypothetical protein
VKKAINKMITRMMIDHFKNALNILNRMKRTTRAMAKKIRSFMALKVNSGKLTFQSGQKNNLYSS